MKIRIARALTKPVITERETKRISAGSFASPAAICRTPVSTVATSRYCRPWSRTRSTISSAIAPVAAEIIAGRPPAKAITTAMENEAYRPTLGSTPAMIENAIASGISASATTRPERTSPRTLPNHCWRSFCKSNTDTAPARAWRRLPVGSGKPASLPAGPQNSVFWGGSGAE